MEAQTIELHRDVARALVQAALADELLTIARDDLAWMELSLRTTEERYRAGTASVADVLRLQNDRSRQADRLLADEAARDNAFVTVNRLLNRNANSAWAPLALPPVGEPLPESEALVQRIMALEPRLLVLRRQIEYARAVAAATGKEGRPDLSIGAEARQYSGTGEARSGAVLLKLSLPWLNRQKYRSALHRDEAKVQEAQHMADDRIYEVTSEWHHLHAKIASARREAVLNREEIGPRSEQALRLAEASWVAGTGMLRDVLEVRRMLLEARTSERRAIAEQHLALWELAALTGLTDLESLYRLASTARSSIP